MNRAMQFMGPIVLAAAAAVGLLSVWVFADDTSEVSELPAPCKVGKMPLPLRLGCRSSCCGTSCAL